MYDHTIQIIINEKLYGKEEISITKDAKENQRQI
jgi:hypothetical protein